MACKKMLSRSIGDRTFVIPCGQCMPCLIQKSMEIKGRLMMELKSNDPNRCHFVTLTVMPEFRRYARVEDRQTGEIRNQTLLEQDESQRLLKRIRYFLEKHEETFRYHLIMEYGSDAKMGSRGYRPPEQRRHAHLHIMFINVDREALREAIVRAWSVKDKGQKVETRWMATYQRQAPAFPGHKWDTPVDIPSEWLKGRIVKGRIHFGFMEEESCNYVSGYQTKGMKNKKSEKLAIGQPPEFRLASKNPPLGHDFIVNMAKELIEEGVAFAQCQMPHEEEAIAHDLERIENEKKYGWSSGNIRAYKFRRIKARIGFREYVGSKIPGGPTRKKDRHYPLGRYLTDLLIREMGGTPPDTIIRHNMSVEQEVEEREVLTTEEYLKLLDQREQIRQKQLQSAAKYERKAIERRAKAQI